LADTLSDIVDDGYNDDEDQGKRLPSVTAEDLLKKAKEQTESKSTDDNIGNNDE